MHLSRKKQCQIAELEENSWHPKLIFLFPKLIIRNNKKKTPLAQVSSCCRLVGLNKVDSKPDQYLQFDVTAAVKDVSQTTVPFLDAQAVAPSPATWLAGAGLYHRVGIRHRVDRVIGFFSSRRNWDSLTRRRVCPLHPLVPGGGAHSLAREWVGESQFQPGDIHYFVVQTAQPTARPSSLLRSCTCPFLQCCCGSGPGSERFSRRVRICPFLILKNTILLFKNRVRHDST